MKCLAKDRWFLYLDNSPAREGKCKVNLGLRYKERPRR
jgi:hypothetical protein